MLTNALITGGSGMIGSKMNYGTKPSSTELNITDINQINDYMNTHNGFSCIIHLVALNLRDSENDPIKAIHVNIDGTMNMLNVAKKLNIPFIYLSSGAVFSSSNSNTKFCETHHTSPNCIYGATKCAAENIALSYDKTILIRTGWLFGGNQKKHYKFVDHAYNHIINDRSVICCDNFYGSTTYVMDLIHEMEALILKNSFGVYHIVNDGVSTGKDVGEHIVHVLNKSPSLIDTRPFSDIPNHGPHRSTTEVLVSTRLHKLRHWKLALTEYILSLTKPVTKESVVKKWINRETCRLCNHSIIDFLNLEPTPPANHFINKPAPQEYIPLDVTICEHCKHIQLKQILDSEFLYSHYFYVSSTSSIMTEHLKNSVTQFTKDLTKESRILEIGANDGVCIKELLNQGFVHVLGIDPATNIHSRHNLPILCDYFGNKSKHRIQSAYATFNLIYAFHCMAHIEDIQDVFTTIYELLEPDGVFIMEVGYFYEVFKTKQFDVIYHEHIDYHTCTAIDVFSRTKGLYLFNVIENSIQGGSIQFYFTKNKQCTIQESVKKSIQKETDLNLFNIDHLYGWQFEIEKVCNDMNVIINGFVNTGKKIAAYGASAKSTTFLHQLKISKHVIRYIVDDNVYKQNFYSPGLNIPIKPSNILSSDKVDYIIILSCNFSSEIIQKLDMYRKTGLRIILPFPEIRII